MSVAGYLAMAAPLRLSSGGAAVALPLLAIEATADVAVGGSLAAASLAPSIVAAPVVGAVIDRTPRPAPFVAVAGGLTALAFAAASLTGPIPLPLVFLLVLCAGAASPFYMGGLSSVASLVVTSENRTFGVDALAYNIGSVVGPAVVAAATAFGSARIALVVMSGCALAGAVATLVIGLPRKPAEAGSMLHAIAIGARHLVRHRPIALVTISGAVSQLGAGGLAIASVALAIERTGSPDGGAVVVTAFAVGALLGTIAISVRPVRIPPARDMRLGFAATGLATMIAALALGPGLVWTTVLVGLSGLFTSSSTASMLLLRMQQSPAAVRSQVFTIGAGLRSSANALGAGLAGAANGLGGQTLLVAIGVVWLASAALMLGYPRDAPRLDG